ncbi:hypothetical protein [Roseovarius arcticus]|uniref:hypothetical protein n=1 Tax=Roseovarius arcticus TaxID=2547404 RepID=UPI001110418A|nr:hypothetical protein [Roseovarius arcticus]
MSAATDMVDVLARRVRTYLRRIASQATPITYQALASSLDLSPPNTIRQLTAALERLIEQDAAAGRPLIAALVVSKNRTGLPAIGFFECAQRVGRFDGDPSGLQRSEFHAAEFSKAAEFWGAVDETVDAADKRLT